MFDCAKTAGAVAASVIEPRRADGGNVRGLSLTQPWASLVALGAKTIETRSWSTSYRGPVFIHAGRQFPADAQSLCHRDPFVDALLEGGYRRYMDLPLGVVVAVATLECIVPTEDIDDVFEAAMRNRERWPWVARQQAFGNFAPRRFAWFLSEIQRVPSPVAVRGMQGLWTPPEPVAVNVMAQLGIVV
jgi:hypothetical protein